MSETSDRPADTPEAPANRHAFEATGLPAVINGALALVAGVVAIAIVSVVVVSHR